jgi:hypothetical protein
MKNLRILRTGQPLALTAIAKVAPAVFAEHPHSSRGDRYQYVPTIRPLETLLENGWGVYEASQASAQEQGRAPFARHMLRMRKLVDFDVAAVVGEGVGEIILQNAHDGTCAYSLKAGFFRFVCSNGMVVGKDIAAFKVIHTKSKNTSLEILEAGERTITEKFPLMLENIRTMQQAVLSPEQSYTLAEEALRLRYGTMLPPFKADDLLNVRRSQDAGYTAWKVLNRIQENVMQGGWETRSMFTGRKSAVRPVEAVGPSMRINEGLWSKAAQLVAEVA